MQKNERLLFIGFLIILTISLTLRLSSTMLWDEDEVAYASFAKRMYWTSDWLTQQAMWCDIHRKPPLHFWAILGTYHIFGLHDWCVRLPSVLAMLGTLATMYFGLRRPMGERVAMWACMILGSSVFIPNIAKVGVLDTELLLYETLAAIAMFNILQERSRTWTALFWVAVTLGILQKGPPTVILLGGMFVLLWIFHPNRKNLWSLRPFIFAPIALLPLLSWGWLLWQKDNGVFIKWLIDWYILKRVGGDNVVNKTWTGPPGYHFAILFVSMITWLPFFFPALITLVQNLRKRLPEALFFGSWLLFSWLFYEFSPSKLPAYSIAAQPVFAILMAQQALQAEEKDYKWRTWIRGGIVVQVILSLVIAVALVVEGAYLFRAEGIKAAMPLAMTWWVMALAAAIALYADSIKWARILLLINGLAITILAWTVALPLIEHRRDATRRAVAVASDIRNAHPEADVLMLSCDAGTNMPSLVFYGNTYFKTVEQDALWQAGAERFRDTTHCVFLVDKANYERTFHALIPENKCTKVPIWIIDRNRESYYMVFTNFER
jgi:4-amino-4-deoxy-L-arabinose transferase-like glycosyltransferase